MSWLRRFFRWSPRVIRAPRRPPVSREVWERAYELVKPSIRRCWRPRCEAADGSVLSSKFGGTPWLSPDETPPVCGFCRAPLPLFVQINAADLPQEAAGTFKGLLQLFYCASDTCDPTGDAWDGFGKLQLCRLVANPREHTPRSFKGALPPQRIVGWDPRDDLPAPGEVSRDWPEGLEAAFYDHGDEIDHSPYPQSGDKLLGWPEWVQGLEYVDCPDCRKPMRYVFQVDSEDHIPYMFGDAGVGHISYCPEHPHRVAFRWACS